jgi:hypothetical protein
MQKKNRPFANFTIQPVVAKRKRRSGKRRGQQDETSVGLYRITMCTVKRHSIRQESRVSEKLLLNLGQYVQEKGKI